MSHIHIDVENVSFGYEKGKEILREISLHASETDSIGIIGANGVGKSTFLKMLVGLNLDFTGSIRIEEIPVEKGTLAQIRSKIGYVFQDSDSQLFMSTVYEDVAFAPRNYGKSEEEVERLTMRALGQVCMEGRKDRQIYRLSGGEKKLASIATVLAMEAKLMLLDEPTVALDPKNRKNLIRVINGLPGAKIIASHDLDFVYDTCQRVVLLYKGEIAADGDAEKILTDRKLLETHGLELPLSFSRKFS